MQLARSICWCVTALLPATLSVAFLVSANAQALQMLEPGAVILSSSDIPIAEVKSECVNSISWTLRLHGSSLSMVAVSLGEVVLRRKRNATPGRGWPAVCVDTAGISFRSETTRHIILDKRMSDAICGKAEPQLVCLVMNRV